MTIARLYIYNLRGSASESMERYQAKGGEGEREREREMHSTGNSQGKPKWVFEYTKLIEMICDKRRLHAK